jgi:hypothetical protein
VASNHRLGASGTSRSTGAPIPADLFNADLAMPIFHDDPG